MAKPEWGAKRTCLSCGTKFYDFARDPIVCPSCEAASKVESQSKPKRGSRAKERAEAAKPAAPPAVVDNDKKDDDEAATAPEDGDEEVAIAAKAGLINDDAADESENESESENENDVLESDPDEDIEAELSSEIDTDFKKGDEET